MSTRRGIWRIGLLLSVARDTCKRTAGRFWWFAARRHGQLEVAPLASVSHPLPIGSSKQVMELEELIKVLRIGERIRVFCDDGVIVAEKISQTQFKLIHCQTMSELVH